MIEMDGFPTASGPLDLRVERGEVVLLKGPNGSGKTSLLRSLAGLPAPLAPARVLVGGVDPARVAAPLLRATCSLSPQDARDALVGLTLQGEARLRGRPLPASLAPLAHREVATLSSGEARRAALAFAHAPVLLLDEPAEGLDAEGRERLLAAVKRAAREGCVVAADHGGVLAPLATRTVELGHVHERDLLLFPAAGAGPRVTSDAVSPRGLRLPALSLGPGFHVLTGPNGAGKSTLLLHLAGVEGGEGARIDGEPARPGATARMAPPHAKDALTRESVAEELAGTDETISNLLVPPALLPRHPLALSGGEAQRVLLAKVLGRPAPLYLLDEPEAHLDAEGRAALRDALARRVQEGSCVLAATHDPAFLALARTRTEVGA